MRDRAWAQRILQGDKAAGERLVTQNYARVYGVLRSLTGDRDAAEDLTQQTFTRAWQALGGYRGEASLATWLCRIAYHEYTHWLRAASGRKCAALAEAADLPDPHAAIGLKTVMVARALAQLTDELRETFLLRYERELSVAEVAIVLEVPAGTVKSRLFTARARLRELLADPPLDAVPVLAAAPLAPRPYHTEGASTDELPATDTAGAPRASLAPRALP